MSACEMEKTDTARLGDFIVVGVVALVLGLLLCLPSTGMFGVSGGVNAVGAESSQTDDIAAAILSVEDTSGGIAATVNGVPIGENAVTAYVANFRSTQGLEDNADWGQWLYDYGYTLEALRSDTIDYFVSQELLRQAAEEMGIHIDASAVDAQIAEQRAQFASDEEWHNALEAAGVDEALYRSVVEMQLLQEALADSIAGEISISDEEIVEFVKANAGALGLDGDAESLDAISSSVANEARTTLETQKKQQAFSDWMNDFKSAATIEVSDMPAGLPYLIDMAEVENANRDGGVAGNTGRGGYSETREGNE